jgi:hypothetical protein
VFAPGGLLAAADEPSFVVDLLTPDVVVWHGSFDTFDVFNGTETFLVDDHCKIVQHTTHISTSAGASGNSTCVAGQVVRDCVTFEAFHGGIYHSTRHSKHNDDDDDDDDDDDHHRQQQQQHQSSSSPQQVKYPCYCPSQVRANTCSFLKNDAGSYEAVLTVRSQ